MISINIIKAYLSAIAVTNISQHFTYKMSTKINWHRQGTKLHHCHPMCSNGSIRPHRSRRKGHSIVLARWHQSAPASSGSLGPKQVSTQLIVVPNTRTHTQTSDALQCFKRPETIRMFLLRPLHGSLDPNLSTTKTVS